MFLTAIIVQDVFICLLVGILYLLDIKKNPINFIYKELDKKIVDLISSVKFIFKLKLILNSDKKYFILIYSKVFKIYG